MESRPHHNITNDDLSMGQRIIDNIIIVPAF